MASRTAGAETLGSDGPRELGSVAGFSKWVDYFERTQPQIQTNGAASFVANYELPRNALVERFEVTVTAGQAEWTPAGNVAKLRPEASGASVVVDLGILRTVSGVGLLHSGAFPLGSITPWLGTKFVDNVPDPESATFSADSRAGRQTVFALLFDELQTQKLKITLNGVSLSEAELGAKLLLRLPEIPADLTIRLNGGAPIWSFPGAVPVPPPAGASASAPLPTGWAFDEQGFARTKVDLTAALAALAGDASAEETSSTAVQIGLTARIPGVLSLDLPSAAGDGNEPALDIKFLATVPAAARTLNFGEEGVLRVPLAAPSWARRVLGARLVVRAKLAPDRTLPAEGPLPLLEVEPGSAPPSPYMAELVLDASHAVVLKLSDTRMAQLSALRVPLRAAEGGAEVRVVLLRLADDQGPGEPLDGGTSQPVTLDAPRSKDEIWTTIPFPRPVKLSEALWAKVLVTRGSASWAVSADPSAPITRRGPADGPFLPLPPIVLPVGPTSFDSLSNLRAGARVSGRPSPDAPVAPLLLELVGVTTAGVATPTELTPSAKGSPAKVTPLGEGLDASGVALKVTSRLAGDVTLDQVELIVSK